MAVPGVLMGYAAIQWGSLGLVSGTQYDEGVYLLSARALADGHALFREVFSSQPPAFLEALAFAFRLGGDRLESGRLFILAFSLLALVAVADLGRRLGGACAGSFAAFAMAVSATFLQLGHVVQAETPALATALAALCIALEARRRSWPLAWCFAAGALMGIALLFKLFVAPFVVALAALLTLAPGDAGPDTWRLERPSPRVLMRGLVVVAGILAAPLACFFVYDRDAMIAQAIGFHLAKHSVYALHPVGNLSRIGFEIVGDAASAALALGAVVMLARRAPLAAAWLCVWMGGAVVALVGQTPLFWRHFVLLTPPMAVGAGLAAAMLVRNAPPRARRLVVAGVVVALLLPHAARLLEHGGSLKVYAIALDFRPRSGALSPRIARWLASNTRPDETVVGDDQTAIYLAGRRTTPALCDTSRARIAARFLGAEEAIRESTDARVLVLRRGGRLLALRDYAQWVGTHFERIEGDARVGGSIWVRRVDAAPTTSR